MNTLDCLGNVNKQCKEIEENDRIGKTRDLLKKIGDIKGTYHERMGTIKVRPPDR